MAGARTARVRASAAALVMMAIVAGCGSSSTSSSKSTASATPSSSATNVSAKGVSIGTANGSDGTHLVSASGRALYLWVADTGAQSNCSGACAKVWPPLLTNGTPVAAGSVSAADLGTISRSDGTKQVTYKGHPLYYFIADHAAGMTKGQGSNSFGAKWWLLTPSGTAITTGSSAPASSGGNPASSSAGSSSGSSGGGGWS